MRVFRVAAIIALLAGPAYAQQTEAPMPRYGDIDKPAKTQQQIDNDREAAKAYEHSLGNIPDKGPSDPWGNTRGADAPKPAAKPVTKAAKVAPKPLAKTGDTAN
jgi:hypothetical protein